MVPPILRKGARMFFEEQRTGLEMFELCTVKSTLLYMVILVCYNNSVALIFVLVLL